MIAAMNKGAKKTKEGTAEAFFFHAMVDRLLEEYRDLGGTALAEAARGRRLFL